MDTKAGFCSQCCYETVRFGDIKPYLLDRTDEFAIYDKDNENFTIMCCKCWKAQDEMDNDLYKSMGIPIKMLTWDKPLPKDHQETAPTIIQNTVINNITNTTNNINHNTSNLIPTYNTSNLIPTYNTNNINTTNNNTAHKITKIIDPDGIIDNLSPEYQRILKKANKAKAEREARERREAKERAKQMKDELNKKILSEKYDVLKKIADDAEEQQCALREKEQLLEEKRKQELHDNKIKLEIEETKRINKQRMDKKNNEIEAIENGYNVSFGTLSCVEQPDETLKKYNGGLLTCLICSRCKIIKAYPNGFLDTYGRLNENRVDNKDICSECLTEKSRKVCENISCNMVKCKCGVSYYGATFEARQKHEASTRHIKALGRNKKINGKTYSVLQLRKICNVNKNADGTLTVAGFTRMNKEEILERLLKIENLIIPEGL
jgi:hypothetical protein